MDNVIDVQTSDTHLLNKMRKRMKMSIWREQWYKAQKEENWDEMIRLAELEGE